MGLAYKLFKIGNVLTGDDIKKSIKDEVVTKEGEEPNYVSINFNIFDEKIERIQLKSNAVSREKMFFTKKIGGSGEGIYYLYPNLNIQKETLGKKFFQLLNTISNSVVEFASEENKIYAKKIIDLYKDVERYFEKELLKYKLENNEDEKTKRKLAKLEIEINKKEKILDNVSLNMINIFKQIIRFPKDNYWFWISINGETCYERMPEIWSSWYKYPVIKNDDVKMGYDAFINTNEKVEVGYRPDVKVFSYDNYDDSLNFRINENLPLSLQSARKIKFAWMYILNNLVFYYKGLQYVIIPNLLSDNSDIYKKILERFRQANKKTNSKKTVLESLRQKEKKLSQDIEKLQKNNDGRSQSDTEKLRISKDELSDEIKKIDLGIIQEFEEQINEVGKLKSSITVNYIFTSINRTNLSFEIRGSIDDVVPSHISKVVDLMRRYNISDLVALKRRDKEKIYLQDFFNRDELYFALNRTTKNNKSAILTERLHLAKLLLSDEKIKMDDLLKLFEKNREYNYGNEKRIGKDGVKEWINYSQKFLKEESAVMNFLHDLNKIKE